MNQSNAILHHLKSRGFRQTRLRQILAELFLAEHLPLDFNQISKALASHNLHPNKTTIYRELDFLVAQAIIQEVDLGEGKKRYEHRDESHHHHHLICESCHRIEDVHLADDLAREEKNILIKKKFLVKKHMLEFFGVCYQCQQKG